MVYDPIESREYRVLIGDNANPFSVNYFKDYASAYEYFHSIEEKNIKQLADRVHIEIQVVICNQIVTLNRETYTKD